MGLDYYWSPNSHRCDFLVCSGGGRSRTNSNRVGPAAGPSRKGSPVIVGAAAVAAMTVRFSTKDLWMSGSRIAVTISLVFM